MASARSIVWYLEGLLPVTPVSARVPLTAFPFTVGRDPTSSLCLADAAVSWAHAEIVEEGATLELRDRGSTNGTWHNGTRVRAPVRLEVGDSVRFGSVELLVGCFATATRSTTQFHASAADRERIAPDPRALLHLLRSRAVDVVFQPIFRFGQEEPVGFEALGRLSDAALPGGVGAVFELADRLGLAAELSQLLRARAIEEARVLGAESLFLNTHASETDTDLLVAELSRLRDQLPGTRLVLEVHEAMQADPPRMRIFADRLGAVGVAIAYDDFGAGQARLRELGECPPAYLKFDRGLVENLDQAGPRKQQLVGSLVQMATELGVVPLAEGIERVEEARMCRQLGFVLAQGYLFGRPAPADTWLRGR